MIINLGLLINVCGIFLWNYGELWVNSGSSMIHLEKIFAYFSESWGNPTQGMQGFGRTCCQTGDRTPHNALRRSTVQS